MARTTGRLSERAGQLKEKRPGYAPLLDFFVRVRELQVATKDLPADLAASADLFRSLCRLGKAANPHFAAQAERIGHALGEDEIALKVLMKGGGDEGAIARAAAERCLDEQVLSFLVRSSTRPSIEAASERLRGEVDLDSHRGVRCPICDSPPSLNLLRREGGQRYSVCAHCACEWRVDRLSCAVCGNAQAGLLHYFSAEGEEGCRIDLCDACHHYVKTIDCRSLEECDPDLEDLATIHLDVVAAEKGYERPVPNPWVMHQAESNSHTEGGSRQ